MNRKTCACRVNEGDGAQMPWIEWCPLHAVTADLVEAGKKLLARYELMLDSERSDKPDRDGDIEYFALFDIITKAEGKRE